MVEGLDVPFDQRKVFAIVLRVTARALLAGIGWDVIGRMQSLAGIEAGGDLSVAVQAFEDRLSAKLVATGTIGRTVERLMRTRQRPGRDLCACRRHQHADAESEPRSADCVARDSMGSAILFVSGSVSHASVLIELASRWHRILAGEAYPPPATIDSDTV